MNRNRNAKLQNWKWNGEIHIQNEIHEIFILFSSLAIKVVVNKMKLFVVQLSQKRKKSNKKIKLFFLWQNRGANNENNDSVHNRVWLHFGSTNVLSKVVCSNKINLYNSKLFKYQYWLQNLIGLLRMANKNLCFLFSFSFFFLSFLIESTVVWGVRKLRAKKKID